MLRLTANYAHTNHNFVIQNLHGGRINDFFVPPVCVLKNILQRGTPTIMSKYLQSNLGNIQDHPEFRVSLPLISNVTPRWLHTIKGDEKNNYYPARDFFNKVIPQYLSEYHQIQQLILPEAAINEIAQIETNKFVGQCVDFYLPQAKLIIEIDGQQHKRDDQTRVNDGFRDKNLAARGYATIRINTIDIERKNSVFFAKIDQILNRLKAFNENIAAYHVPFQNPDEAYGKDAIRFKLLPTAVIRFQLLLLELIERGMLRCDATAWKFNVLERDVRNFVSLAVEDTCLWLEHICKLQRIDFKRPVINVSEIFSECDFSHLPDAMNIDFSLLRRWTDENELTPHTIMVRTDYYDYEGGKRDYGRINTTAPVTYEILADSSGKDADLLRYFLKNIFDLEDFKDGQLRILANALSLRDTIGLLPTSGGKSLCYQLASLLQPAVSFVVCPIKSLMNDQKYNLDNIFINRTAFITSDLDATTKSKVANDFSRGRYLWIWISPERMQSEDFRVELETINKKMVVSYAVIDEVHCLSEWGHDFRTSYLNLAKTIRRYLPCAKYLGLTATASINVLKDIQNEFNIPTEHVKTLTKYSRPELEFRVIDTPRNKMQKVTQILRQLDAEKQILQLREDESACGLIFTPHVNGDYGCYKVANELSRTLKTDVRWYSGEVPKIKHNGNSIPLLKNEDFAIYKNNTQKEFQENRFPILVATKAFGMGVNKKNIRFTIHYGIPGSMESLYQEAGRAGRDNQPSQCYVVFSPEKMGKEKIDVIFGLDTTLKTIREVESRVGREKQDALRNLYLWFSQQQDIEVELDLIQTLMSLCPPNSRPIIDTDKITMRDADADYTPTKISVEKAIYRLSILGVIKDWTIADWFNGRFKVEVNDYDQKTIQEHLTKYVKKYDPQFDYENAATRYESREAMEKPILILLQWIYDHFAYNRRQSIKNVYELCAQFKSKDNASAWFKQELEAMFKFSEVSYSLDEIAENPTDYDRWFAIFYVSRDSRGGEIISIEGLHAIRSSLARFLESYQFNTGLNVISGLVRLVLDDFDNADGKPRLISAMKQIIEMDDFERNEIFFRLLEFGRVQKKPAKQALGDILASYYAGKEEEIYLALGDNTSLMAILKNANQRLSRIGGVLYDRRQETEQHY